MPPTSIPSVPWIVDTCRRTFIAIGRLLLLRLGDMLRTNGCSLLMDSSGAATMLCFGGFIAPRLRFSLPASEHGNAV